ncbi:MAG: hypothetical protein ABH887_01630 [bacterium]
MKIIRRIFPYRSCDKKIIDYYLQDCHALADARAHNDRDKRPCLYYQIKLCPGVCIGEISKKDYQKNIKNIVMLLSGQKKRLLNKLKKENSEKIKSLEHIQDVTLLQKDNFEFSVSKINRIEGYDISHLTGKETYGAMVVFEDNKPNKTQYRLFKIKSAPANDDLRALGEMIERRFNHLEWQWPDLILVDGGKSQIDFVYKILQQKQINIPLIGISKYQNDRLVFAPKTKKNIKELSEIIKKTLLQARDEAHRFGLKASRRRRKII